METSLFLIGKLDRLYIWHGSLTKDIKMDNDHISIFLKIQTEDRINNPDLKGNLNQHDGNTETESRKHDFCISWREAFKLGVKRRLIFVVSTDQMINYVP